ncbi:Rieske 2Fe-2S domain-containing protein [Pseudonocardia benzenivorans]
MTTDERSEPGHDSLSDATQSKKVSTKWRGYLDATLGFRNHWNPVGYGHEIAEGAFVAVTALDEPILLTRVDGEVRAIQDRCAHRGARFSAQPLCFRKGTVSCWYHGWTYDLADGRLSDVLTSPGSPVIGRVRVPTYPVVEAQGLVFVYVGDGDPPALAHDVPLASSTRTPTAWGSAGPSDRTGASGWRTASTPPTSSCTATPP